MRRRTRDRAILHDAIRMFRLPEYLQEYYPTMRLPADVAAVAVANRTSGTTVNDFDYFGCTCPEWANPTHVQEVLDNGE